MKAHIIGQSHECILMSYYLLPPVNHHQQADLFYYHNPKLQPGQSKSEYELHHWPVECLECRNNKSNRLTLHTVYGLDTLRIYLYSPLLACNFLEKYEIRPKIWLEDLTYCV